jgi:hypothetical protein
MNFIPGLPPEIQDQVWREYYHVTFVRPMHEELTSLFKWVDIGWDKEGGYCGHRCICGPKFDRTVWSVLPDTCRLHGWDDELTRRNFCSYRCRTHCQGQKVCDISDLFNGILINNCPGFGHAMFQGTSRAPRYSRHRYRRSQRLRPYIPRAAKRGRYAGAGRL